MQQPSNTSSMDTSPSPESTPAPGASGAGRGAPPPHAAGRSGPGALGGGDPLDAYRDVFGENEGLEAALHEHLGTRGNSAELAQALEAADTFLNTHGTESDRKFLAASGLSNDPAVISFLHRQSQAFGILERDLQKLEVENARLRQLLDEPTTLRTVPAAGPSGQSQAMTNEAIEDEISMLWANHAGALTNPSHRAHQAMVRRLERLQRTRYGG